MKKTNTNKKPIKENVGEFLGNARILKSIDELPKLNKPYGYDGYVVIKVDKTGSKDGYDIYTVKSQDKETKYNNLGDNVDVATYTFAIKNGKDVKESKKRNLKEDYEDLDASWDNIAEEIANKVNEVFPEALVDANDIHFDDSRAWSLYVYGDLLGLPVYKFGAYRDYMGGGVRGGISHNGRTQDGTVELGQFFADKLAEIEDIINSGSEGEEEWDKPTGVLLKNESYIDKDDMTADELAYERYKKGKCSYKSYLNVVFDEETYPEAPIGKDINKYPLYNYYEVELEDDETPNGGTNSTYDHAETVFDFIMEAQNNNTKINTLEELNKALKQCGIKPIKTKDVKESKLVEKPVRDLSPRYDSRQSFYGKARIDTGNNDDENKLYSYHTLVAELVDGFPRVYGTYSQTTLRHIKEWLKQLGFRAETSKQIMQDYGYDRYGKGRRTSESCKGAQCKECGDKPLREDSSDVFQHLSDSDVETLYNKFTSKGLNEEDAYEKIQYIDDNLDYVGDSINELSYTIEGILDDCGIMYGDVVTYPDKLQINIVGVDEEEWEDAQYEIEENTQYLVSVNYPEDGDEIVVDCHCWNKDGSWNLDSLWNSLIPADEFGESCKGKACKESKKSNKSNKKSIKESLGKKKALKEDGYLHSYSDAYEIIDECIDEVQEAVNDGEDVDEAIWEAIDRASTYNEDILLLAEHYGAIDYGALCEAFYDDFYSDIYNGIDEQGGEDEFDEEDEYVESLMSKYGIETQKKESKSQPQRKSLKEAKKPTRRPSKRTPIKENKKVTKK